MPDVNATLVLAMVTAMLAAAVGLARPDTGARDLRISRSELSATMLEAIPGVTASKGTRIRALLDTGLPLPDALSRFLTPEEAQRLEHLTRVTAAGEPRNPSQVDTSGKVVP